MSFPAFLSLPLSEIAESPTNPRRRFDDLEELAESIREVGILEPVLVRPRSMEPRPPGVFFPFELVCGARRLRAARLAGLPAVPAMVRELDDAQVLELQLVENNQRQDVGPMEEAGAFSGLLRLGRSAEDIASRIGRSVGYVRSRLRLLELVPEVRALLEEGRIHVGSALLLAQVTDAQQREAAQAMSGYRYRAGRHADDPWTTGDVAALLRERSRRMSLALWPLDDADLVPEVGACSTCPRRTGSQRALLAEMEGDDQCLDAACWSGKREATLDAARARGEVVLEGPALERASDAGTYLDLDGYCEDEDFPEAYGEDDRSARTWRESLARIGVEPSEWTLAVQPSGAVERWVSAAHLAGLVEDRWPEAARLLRMRAQHDEPVAGREHQRPAGVEWDDERESDGDGEESAEDRRERERAEYEARQAATRAEEAERKAIEGRARLALTIAVVQHTETSTRAGDALAWLLPVTRVALACADVDAVRGVAARRGIDPVPASHEGHRLGIEAWLVTQDEAAPVAGLLAELVSATALRSHWLFSDDDSPHGEHGPFRVLPLLAAAGVQPGAAIRIAKREHAKAEAEAQKAADKAAKKAAKKAATKVRVAREVRDGA